MNTWDEPTVTDTALDTEIPVPDAEGQTEDETTAAETETSDDWESRVNSLVEQKVAERLATLDTEVQRRVQSELQKRKNRADKQLAEDTRAIERMAQRGQIDTDRKAELLAAAQQEAQQAKNVWEVDEEETQVAPPQTQVPVQTRLVSRQELVSYLQTQGLTENDMDISRYAGLPNTMPGAREAFLADVEAAKQKRQAQAPSQAAKVVQKLGNTAAPTGNGQVAGYRPSATLDDANDVADEIVRKFYRKPR